MPLGEIKLGEAGIYIVVEDDRLHKTCIVRDYEGKVLFNLLENVNRGGSYKENPFQFIIVLHNDPKIRRWP